MPDQATTLNAILGRKGLNRYHVEDWSMAPSLVPGDVVIARETSHMTEELKENAIVIIHDPEQPGRKLIKRVKSMEGMGSERRLFVVGDNELSSRDSRQFGPIRIGALVGIVVDGQ